MCQPDGDQIGLIESRLESGDFLEDDDLPIELETEEARWLVSRFWELHNRREFAHPIGYGDLAAYQAITGRRLSAWQVRQLTRLDNLYLENCGRLMADLAKRK